MAVKNLLEFAISDNSHEIHAKYSLQQLLQKRAFMKLLMADF